MNSPGIYKIQSKIKPERIYVGSAVNVKHRWVSHLSDLRLNKHGNSRLQNHFNKYGASDLVFILLESCTRENLLIREQVYIDELYPWFNICKFATSRKGVIHSLETREKSRIGHLGQVPWNKGKTEIYSEETRQNISESVSKSLIGNNRAVGHMPWNKDKKTGIKPPNAFKPGEPSWNKDIPHSDQHKDNLSKAWERRRLTPMSEETRNKISEAVKQFWANKKQDKAA